MTSPNSNPWAARVLLILGRLQRRWLFRAWSVFLGCDLECRDYGILFLPHPYGIVVHARTTLGQGCTIFQNVTIGTGDGRDVSASVGSGVVLGAGAVVLGDVVIGDGARIGANAVVLRDVPGGATAVGVPAVVVHRPS